MVGMRVLRCAVCFVSVLFVMGDLSAGELNDSIQQFHRGDFKNSYDGLTKLVQAGQQDARIYYYRGLIAYRFGDRKAAASDFQSAANVEAAGMSQGVSESLERIQGRERLILEKYRSMARLAARRKQQPVAPPAIQRKPVPQIQLVSNYVPLATPSFRLASEVPIRGPRTADPFKDDAEILVDKKPQEPKLVLSASGSEEPVGTGVKSTEEEDDIFGGLGSDDTETGDDFLGDDSDVVQSGDGPKATVVFGSIFRALSRTVVPQVSPEAILPPGGIPGMQPPPPGEGFPGQPQGEGPPPGDFPDDGFSDGGFTDEGGENPF